jgi:hypothetical protein
MDDAAVGDAHERANFPFGGEQRHLGVVGDCSSTRWFNAARSLGSAFDVVIDLEAGCESGPARPESGR